MNNLLNYQTELDELAATKGDDPLYANRQKAGSFLTEHGFPTSRTESWKYTRISGLINRKFDLSAAPLVTINDVDAIRLPDSESANELIFVNGQYSPALSTIRSQDLKLYSLEEGARNNPEIFERYYHHSTDYLNDGITALNAALSKGGIFLMVHKGKTVEHPVYIYNITDSRNHAILSQPRSLIYVCENAGIELVESYCTLGLGDSFTNEVIELVLEENASAEYYKIQNDASHTNQVSTTHVRQIGKSYLNTVTISLNGGTVRNNLNILMEAPHTEAHLYGLYFPKGKTHIDNHTIVDNRAEHCLSNELYKGILTGQATGVFNGKVFVRPDAQKINAYQNNKNILLSEQAQINAKPELEIYADDVKCSHGCTIGKLDDEALFYLRARGIAKNKAISLLLQGFAEDILNKIKHESIREYAQSLISSRLETETL